MENSLSKVHPELVAEWSEKNYPATPESVSYGSNKKYWWKGPCGHEWQASVKSRHAGERCPICANMRVVSGINDLETVRPDLAVEWSERNLLTASEVSAESHRKVWWKGPCGHEWDAEIRNRARTGSGCPYCSSRKLLRGFNDLKTRYPNLAKEWSPRNKPLRPDMVTAFSNRKAWWRCRTCKNEWYTLISTRSGGSKCPYCSGTTLLPGFNDLKTRRPELADEWSDKNGDLLPESVNEKSHRNVWWRCNICGYEYRAVIASRVKGLTCPVCANKTVLTGINDLKTTDPKLSEEWDCERNSLLPTRVSRVSHERVWWRCRYGHNWVMKISDRAIEGKGCIYCEKEYLKLLPKLAVALYASKLHLRMKAGSEDLTGLPLGAYIPEIGLAIDFESVSGKGAETIHAWNRYICKTRGITLEEICLGHQFDVIRLLKMIKTAFRKKNIFISSDEEEDLGALREAYDKLRERKV